MSNHRRSSEPKYSTVGISKLLSLAKEAGYDLDSHELDAITVLDLEEMIAERDAAKSLKE